MQQSPLISIVTVVFNDATNLEKTILSVINQTYHNIEYIIIDGGSTDGTTDIIKKYQNKIHHWVSEPDQGIYDAMNKGIDIATENCYLLFLNAKDAFVDHNVLQNIVLKIEQIKIKPLFFYGNADIYDDSGNFLSSLKALQFTKKNLNRFATRTLCHQSIFVHQSIMINYDLNYRLKAELNWYYDILKTLSGDKILKIDISICKYFLGGEGGTHFLENIFERIKVTYKQNNLIVFIRYIPFFLIPFIFKLKQFVMRLISSIKNNHNGR